MKSYEFDDQWRDRAISESEIRELVAASVAQAGRPRTLTSEEDIALVMDSVLQLLEETDEVTILEIEPTASDLATMESGSFIRVGAGRWFAAGDLVRNAVLLLGPLLAGHPEFTVAFALKEMKKSWSLLRTITKAYVSFPEDSVEFKVFEAIDQFSRELRITNYVALDNKDHEIARGRRPPTTKEIVADTGCDRAAVLDALRILEDDKVVKWSRKDDSYRIRG